MRIFVTIGSNHYQFNRLINEIDKIKKYDIFVQKGKSISPKNHKYVEFIDGDEFINEIKKSDIIITHGGAGSIVNSLILGKKVIVVPRLKKYGEISDDHQIELGSFLETKGKLKVVEDISKLKIVLDQMVKDQTVKINRNNDLVNFIKNCINEW